MNVVSFQEELKLTYFIQTQLNFRKFSSQDPILAEKLKEATGGTGNIHRSNAQSLISKVPVIKVKSDLAVCDGGGGVLGHPVEYIQLKKFKEGPETCKYCGLRYIRDEEHH